MSYLAFDFECSGLVAEDRPLDDPAQPHLLQIGAAVYDAEFHEAQTLCLLIEPTGWEVSRGALDTHGITTERAAAYGVPVKVALAALLAMARKVRYLVAHNFAFEQRIVHIEMHRLGRRESYTLKHPRQRILDSMLIGTATGAADTKWPKLAAAYKFLTGEPMQDKHDGLSDARASMVCVRRMIASGVIEL